MTTTVSRSSLDEARLLASDLAERAREGEELGTMPADLVERVRRAGLFELALPRSLGGLELAPAEIVQTLEEVCRADGSAGWTITIGNGSSFFAWLDPAVAADLLDGSGRIAAGSFGPNGRLTPSGSAYTLDGRWTFSSGCRHADWFFNGAFPFDGDSPRMIAGRGADWRLVAVPASAVEIIDNWDVAGLKGTGSHDIAVAAQRVAEEHTVAAFFEPARHEGPLYRFPFFTLVGVLFAGFPLGVARRALDEFTDLAKVKTRMGTFTTMANEDDVQLELARSEGRLQAARSFVFDVLDDLWTTALGGDVPTLEQRYRLQLANQEAMSASLGAVDTAFRLAGASAVYSHHQLQRCFRDIHTGCQHIYWAPAASKRWAKARFGLDQSLTFLI